MKIDCSCTDVLHFVDIEYYKEVNGFPPEFIFSVVSTPSQMTFWERLAYVFRPQDIVVGDVILTENDAAKLARYINDSITSKGTK